MGAGLRADRRQAVSHTDPVGPWLTISSAPRDQRAILATHEDNVASVMHVCWRIAADSPDYLNPRTGNTWRPTHWMPLPAPVRAYRLMLVAAEGSA